MTELMQAMAKMQTDKTRADADMIRAQAEAQSKQIRDQIEIQKLQDEMGISQGTLQEKIKDRQAKERIQLIDLAQNLAVHPESAALVAPIVEPVLKEMGILQSNPEGQP